MPWIRIAACAAAALSLASYASADTLEAQLGRPAAQSRGQALPGGPRAPSISPPKAAPAARFQRALDGLQADAASLTRGAADSQVYRRAAPAVVLIVTEEGLGSGALISPDGQILTNHHVIQGAKTIGVVFKPALEGAAIGKADLRRAELLKVDEIADLALIKVEAAPAGIAPLKLGELGKLQVGEDVHAIGHPTGQTWTYTRGIVSQIRRAYEWGSEKSPHEAMVIQTQTPLNPGNSGGPLLDGQAEIVGVNSFVGEGEGINYAVSVEDVKSFLARGRDRLAAATVAAAETCEWQTLRTEAWDDPKGVAEVVDTDCDGEADATILTPRNRRSPVVIATSENEASNGAVDTMYFDANRDGDLDWVLYDTDSDGRFDMRGDYRKGEDEPYRWEKISN